MSWDEWLAQGLRERQDAGLLRRTSVLDWPIERIFSSNDYLGLSHHPDVRTAMSDAALQCGAGPRASALVAGYTDVHAELERRLAALKKTEAALLFPSGYAANVSILRALGQPGDGLAVFADALNHASLIDGCDLLRRRRAQIHVYRHDDVAHLEDLLRASGASRKVVVTDGVFSMDGDVAPLAKIRALCDVYGALLVVDDAHGTLVYGESGAGVAELHNVRVDLLIGTLSKAVGQLGGFVACSAEWRAFLLNFARGFVYSTALPVPVVAGAIEALRVARDGTLRAALWSRISLFSEESGHALDGPIVSVIYGTPHDALNAAEALCKAGYHVIAIRPPTVPEGTSRLRIALSSIQTLEDVASVARMVRQ